MLPSIAGRTFRQAPQAFGIWRWRDAAKNQTSQQFDLVLPRGFDCEVGLFGKSACDEGAPSGCDLATPVNHRLAPVSTPMLTGVLIGGRRIAPERIGPHKVIDVTLFAEE